MKDIHDRDSCDQMNRYEFIILYILPIVSIIPKNYLDITYCTYRRKN